MWGLYKDNGNENGHYYLGFRVSQTRGTHKKGPIRSLSLQRKLLALKHQAQRLLSTEGSVKLAQRRVRLLHSSYRTSKCVWLCAV